MTLPRWTRRLVVTLATLGLTLAAAEVGLRLLLFADPVADWGPARRLRAPGLYAANTGRDYWKLEVLFGPPRGRRAHPGFDARFGWLAETVDPVTLAHRDEPSVGDRRPVLLFGDSFAQCVQRAGPCWQELLEESPLADRFRLLNYGVGGYGLDQAILLMEATLPRFADRDPLVVLAILVDDDVDRAWLPLRGHPKPWFELVDGALRLHAIESTSPEAFVQASPPDVSSYLLRLVLYGARLVDPPTATRWVEGPDLVLRKQALCAALIASVQESWQRNGVEGFVLLFHGQGSALQAQAGGRPRWQGPFLRQELSARGLPWVTSLPRLVEALAAGASASDLYYLDGPGKNHFTTRGNAIVFGALAAGLEGRFDGNAGR